MRLRLPRRLGHGEEASLVEHLIHWLNQPLPADLRKPTTFGVTEPFFTSVKVSLYAGFALALPVILYQLWSFFAPAIEEHSQRVVAMFVTLASGLFAAGLAFAYWVVLPAGIHFLTNYDENLYNIEVRASYYYSFAALLLVAIALIFELPIFVLAFVRLGVLTTAMLRRNRRTGYVVMFIIAVLLPTVDPVSLVFETIPMLILYEGSIWLAVLFEKRWQRSSDAELATG